MSRHLLLAILIATGVATAPSGALADQRVRLGADLDHSVMHAHRKATGYLRVQLEGFTIAPSKKRPPMNVAIVIDKSGSMQGDKIEQAKAAARAALDQLRADDIVSVVAYDDQVTVLVPATKVSDRRAILAGINKLAAGGWTALFAGTAKGAAEVKKFFARDKVNRVILLSDGQANIGPASPGELGRLGHKLHREGITVTTVGLGLGYNEDLMVQLAERSGGHHMFAERASQLAGLFQEGFGSLAGIVANEVEVTIDFAEGFRPVRPLGAPADVIGDRVRARLAALYSGVTDELLLEFETPKQAPSSAKIATIRLAYHNLISGERETLSRSVYARFSDDLTEIEASAHPDVMVSVVAQVANERNELAVRLRDEGKRQEAERLLRDNTAYLSTNAGRWKSPVLRDLEGRNNDDLDNLSDDRWQRQRKVMRQRQSKLKKRGANYDFDEVNF